MALLTQLLGNRELGWEDQLEKGRIWVYGDGNEFTPLCNGFCWKPPGCGRVIIEIYGPGGSSGRGCCCGAAMPSNPGSYARKCICVCPANYICGSIGRACGDTPGHGRGDPEPVGLCWFGCSPNALFWGGSNPRVGYSSWKGNNPWGWGNGETTGNIQNCHAEGKYWSPRGSNATMCGAGSCCVCCAAGHDRGCMCAQGGQSGYFQCTDGGMNAYECFRRTKWCTRVIHATEICGTYQCGIVCGVCSDFSNQYNMRGIRCSFGGDMNCCGTFSCVRLLQCVDNNPSCTYQYHHNTAPMQYSTEGAVFTYPSEHDSPSGPAPGNNVMAMLGGINATMRSPSHLGTNWCWSGGRACGCYEMWGCVAFSPYGVGGYPAQGCGDVRDHGGRGGNGIVRIRYVPTDGGNAY